MDGWRTVRAVVHPAFCSSAVAARRTFADDITVTPGAPDVKGEKIRTGTTAEKRLQKHTAFPREPVQIEIVSIAEEARPAQTASQRSEGDAAPADDRVKGMRRLRGGPSRTREPRAWIALCSGSARVELGHGKRKGSTSRNRERASQRREATNGHKKVWVLPHGRDSNA